MSRDRGDLLDALLAEAAGLPLSAAVESALSGAIERWLDDARSRLLAAGDRATAAALTALQARLTRAGTRQERRTALRETFAVAIERLLERRAEGRAVTEPRAKRVAEIVGAALHAGAIPERESSLAIDDWASGVFDHLLATDPYRGALLLLHAELDRGALVGLVAQTLGRLAQSGQV